MITENQRRALFALREALHLCEGAAVSVSAGLTSQCVHVICTQYNVYAAGAVSFGAVLGSATIDELLAANPEPTDG